MKKAIALVLLAGTFAFAHARAPYPELEDPTVNSINRLPARTYSLPLESVSAALTDAIEPESPYAISLNGDWKISWAGSPDRMIPDFWKPEFDDSAWQTIDVPSCMELRGFGVPGYTNTRYPHRATPPVIRDYVFDSDDYNPVSSYRTSFSIPAGWEGRRIIIRFDGVYSAYHLWVNGSMVGYAEDSKLPSEFDITGFVKTGGGNILAVEVFRWCDGSFLEDQDMFRFSGIFRDVTLIAEPAQPIRDFCVRTTLTNSYRDAKVSLSVDTDSKAVSATLYDATFRKVASFKGRESSASVKRAHLWSAEDPYLYTLVIKAGEDIRSTRVGLKQVEISGNTVLFNGQKIKFKGVNRHEHSAVNGRTVSREEMLQDVLLMKKHNINTVRTCHYPDHHYWYDLCDRYGLYVMAEANVEGHGMRYDNSILGNGPQWESAVVERNVNNVLNYRNHACVTFWSAGNETGHGPNFVKAIAEIHGMDSRPVHWERGNNDADVDSRMYPTVEWLIARGKLGDGQGEALADKHKGIDNSQTALKPFFMCEYAHAMGNAIGNLQEYWDAFYSSDSLLGGCIWDWVDQALLKDGYYAYGGDFDEIPNDGPFCCNGIIRPDRKVTAKLVEVAHVYRQLALSSEDASSLKAELWNRFSFTSAAAFDARWSLLEDGVEVETGAWTVPDVKPLQKAEVALPRPAYEPKSGHEYFMNVYFTLRDGCLWGEKGFVIASDQLPWRSETFAYSPLKGTVPSVSEDGGSIKVECGKVSAEFKRDGRLVSLVSGGKAILSANPELSWMRAFTDNDIWIRKGGKIKETGEYGTFAAYGLTQRNTQYKGARAVRNADGSLSVIVTADVTSAKSAGFDYTAEWRFCSNGTVRLINTAVPYGRMPEALPRLGLSLVLDRSMENMTWYGRGPGENYIDRNTGSFIGRYDSTVTGQYEEYVRPQDNGYKSDVRWVKFSDADGNGVKFSGDIPYIQALHYTWEDLELSRHRNGAERVVNIRQPREDVFVNLDLRQLGLGGNSCGPRPMDKYIFPIKEEKWTVNFEF